MTDPQNSFPADASTVFALMKSFNEQHNALPPTSMDSNDSRETEEMKNRLVAAAMSMLNNPMPPWLADSQIPKQNTKPDLPQNWDEMNLTTQFFSGLVTPSSEATTSPPSEFPFPNPFMMMGLNPLGGKSLAFTTNGNLDEDFCELCQKHFCNKYYLRKHKSDVHRIPSEPFSQVKKRENGSIESDENDQAGKSPTTANDWMNSLTSSASTAQQLSDSFQNRRNFSEGFCPRETNSSPEKNQVSLWPSKQDSKPNRVELGENATFVPPVVTTAAAASTTGAALTSCQTGKALNAGALDMLKSSMAAAKLADRVTCELCKKELCNKYFLRTHKMKVHGLSPQEVGGPPSRSSGSKQSEKMQTENASNQAGAEAFVGIAQPMPLMNPMLQSQFPPPLGSIPSWLPGMPPPPMLTTTATTTTTNTTTNTTTTTPEMPNSPAQEAKKDAVLQLMAANSLVNCPVCERTVGPRLFLPTHLTSVHGLSPTDPSFFILILSAPALESNGDGVTSTAKMEAVPIMEEENATNNVGNAFQLANSSLMRMAFTASAADGVNREPQMSVANSMHGMIPPPSMSLNDVGLGACAGGFDLPIMATAPTTAQQQQPLLFPPPLGLLSPPTGIYPNPPPPPPPPPPTQQQQPPSSSQPQTGLLPPNNPGMMVNPSTTVVPTAKWNPVHLAATGLIPKRSLPNGISGTTPRKSPNQMRVLCDICNKWICNKYFLRTHKANKHGITDQTPHMNSSPQTAGGKTPTTPAAPLDFSKPGKTQIHLQQQQMKAEAPSCNFEDSQQQQPVMKTWSFTNPNPHSPITGSPNVTPIPNIQDNSGERGFPLNLSLKPTKPLVEMIKHGVDQFLSSVPQSFRAKRSHRRRRKTILRLQKRAAFVLFRVRKQLSREVKPPKRRSIKSLAAESGGNCKRDASNITVTIADARPWQNVCQVCGFSANKRSQLEAHCYATGHQRLSRPENIAPTVDEPWWTRQQTWPLNFAQPKMTQDGGNTSVNASATTSSSGGGGGGGNGGGAKTSADGFCSYQASHHMIASSVFNETTTTPTI